MEAFLFARNVYTLEFVYKLRVSTKTTSWQPAKVKKPIPSPGWFGTEEFKK